MVGGALAVASGFIRSVLSVPGRALEGLGDRWLNKVGDMLRSDIVVRRRSGHTRPPRPAPETQVRNAFDPVRRVRMRRSRPASGRRGKLPGPRYRVTGLAFRLSFVLLSAEQLPPPSLDNLTTATEAIAGARILKAPHNACRRHRCARSAGVLSWARPMRRDDSNCRGRP